MYIDGVAPCSLWANPDMAIAALGPCPAYKKKRKGKEKTTSSSSSNQ